MGADLIYLKIDLLLIKDINNNYKTTYDKLSNDHKLLF